MLIIAALGIMGKYLQIKCTLLINICSQGARKAHDRWNDPTSDFISKTRQCQQIYRRWIQSQTGPKSLNIVDNFCFANWRERLDSLMWAKLRIKINRSPILRLIGASIVFRFYFLNVNFVNTAPCVSRKFTFTNRYHCVWCGEQEV